MSAPGGVAACITSYVLSDSQNVSTTFNLLKRFAGQNPPTLTTKRGGVSRFFICESNTSTLASLKKTLTALGGYRKFWSDLEGDG